MTSPARPATLAEMMSATRANLVVTILIFQLCAVFPQIAAADLPATTINPIDDGKPIVLPNARQYDFTSKINNLDYRVMVYISPKLDLSKNQPVFYLFDGNYYFGAACDAMAINELSGIVVGIGYPTDDPAEVLRRRHLDLSLPTADSDKKYGGGDVFLRVVQEEIKPLVQLHYKIDIGRQSLYGHSLGGLMVLRQLFRNPDAYSTYTAASPSIWWHNREVLDDEAAFSKKARAAEVHVKLLLTSAEDEQYHGTYPAQLEKAARSGMVSNASSLFTRLSALDQKNLVVTRALFPNENHRSGSIPSLVRSLNFTFHGAN